MVLLAGIEAQHGLSQVRTAMEEVGQRDEDRFPCLDGNETKRIQNAKLLSRMKQLYKKALTYVRAQQNKCKLTILTGADVEYSSQGAILGGLFVSAETFVVWVDCRGRQGVWLQGVAVHFNPFQIQALLKAG